MTEDLNTDLVLANRFLCNKICALLRRWKIKYHKAAADYLEHDGHYEAGYEQGVKECIESLEEIYKANVRKDWKK